jgi:hypothetical protein
VTWPSAAMTTLESRRTQSTVVERIRRPEREFELEPNPERAVAASERDFALEANLEAAVAVEPWYADERIDISSQYSAAGSVAEWGPALSPHPQEPSACAILPM